MVSSCSTIPSMAVVPESGADADGTFAGLTTSGLTFVRAVARGVAVGVQGSLGFRSRKPTRGVNAEGSDFCPASVVPAFSNSSNNALVRERCSSARVSLSRGRRVPFFFRFVDLSSCMLYISDQSDFTTRTQQNGRTSTRLFSFHHCSCPDLSGKNPAICERAPLVKALSL